MAAPKEIWKPLNDRYSVSNLGRVMSKTVEYVDKRRRQRRKNGKILSLNGTIKGYPVVNVSNYGKRRNWKVHQLVAINFLDNPNNYPCINHKNGIKTDNRVDNLEWCTHSHNLKHAFKIGLREPVINKEGKNGFSKKVFDSNTGKIYDSLTQVVRLSVTEHSYSALRAMLSGQNRNTTSLKYMQHVCGT